jgi:TRAP-type C4-dicarboxylate transport system permease small subunit
MISLLRKWAHAFAIVGMMVALLVSAMTMWSIVSRTLTSKPVQGDVELTAVGIALAISLCIPWCQLRGANIIVDFFTQNLPEKKQRWLDGLGSVLIAAMYALLAWRTGVGALSSFESKETTMILGLPNYLSYLSLAPGLALAAVVAAYQAIAQFRNQSVADFSGAQQ